MKSILILFASLTLLAFSGCTIPKRQLHTFCFPPGKTHPSLQDTNRFKCIMETVRFHTNATLIINGNLYPPNQTLTDERVWIVVNALHSAGIEAERMYVVERTGHNRSHIPNNRWFTVVVVF